MQSIGLRSRRLALGLLASLVVSAASAQEPLSAPGTLQSLTLPVGLPYTLEFRVMLDGAAREIILHKRSIRSADYAGFISDGAGGMRQLEPVAPSTYSGTIEGRPKSLVGAWLSKEGLHAAIVDETGAWLVEPASGNTQRELHRVMRFDEIPASKIMCGTVQSAYRDAVDHGTGSGAAADTVVKVAEVAYDADSVLLAIYDDDEEALQASIEGMIAQSSVIYEFYFGIQYEISGAVIRTAEDDPYADLGLTSSSGVLFWLDAFQTQWNTVEPEASIECDLAHLFSGYTAFLDGSGYANLSAVCNDESHYAISSHKTNHGYDQLWLFCHETGHNWNACHCDDECIDSPCGIMNGSDLGAIGLVFTPTDVTRITTKKAAVGCLDGGTASPAPNLTSVSPAEVPALATGRITLNGEDLDKVHFVHVDSTAFDPSDFGIVDDATIEVYPPRAEALGAADVAVEGPGGTSGTVEFEYVETSPPDIVADVSPSTPTGGTWSYGGLVGKTAVVLVKINSSATTTIGGFQVLGNASIADSEVLSDPGLASFSRSISSALIGSTIYMQVVVYDGQSVLEVSTIKGYPVTG